MVNFLETIISVLPEAQKFAIRALVADKTASGELTSVRAREQEAEQIYSRIKSKIGSILLDPKYAIPGEKISSDEHNQMMESIYLDLTSLYTNIDLLSSVLLKQNITLSSEYSKSRASIEKLLNDVKVFSLRKQYPEYNDIKVIDFNSSTNTTKLKPSAEVDTDVRLLKLKPAIKNRTHQLERSNRHTKVYTKTYGKGIKQDLGPGFPIENIVDQKQDTFWGMLVLADAPISHLYEKTTSSGNVYQVDVSGPVVEIYFRFSHAEKINTIKICPFAEFPIRIIDIAYRSNLSNQIFTPIDDFTPTSTSDWEEYNFKPIHAMEVRISICQENYKKLSYLLPKNVVYNTDIFHRIIKDRANSLVKSDIADSDFSNYLLSNKTSYQEAIESLQDIYYKAEADYLSQPTLQYAEVVSNVLNKLFEDILYNNTSDKINNLNSIESLQNTDAVSTVTVFKYEYLLGLREVFIGNQIYYPSCYYESDKFISDATVSEVRISVEDRHPTFNTEWETDYRKTSIEWSVDFGNNRVIPIHPYNSVDEDNGYPLSKDERIYFDINTRTGSTRLGSRYSHPHRVKKNGVVIPPELWSSIRSTGVIPNLSITLTGSWIDTSSIYTVDYYVAPSSYNIDVLSNFTSEAIVFPEIFSGVGSDNEINLSKFPFINYEIVNSTGHFTKNGIESKWVFDPIQSNITSGQLSIIPTIVDSIGNILQTGSLTGYIVSGEWGDRSGQAPAVLFNDPAASTSYFGTIDGINFGYFVQVMDSPNYGELSTFNTTGTFTLKSPIQVTLDQCKTWDTSATGIVFQGSFTGQVSGELLVDYSIGVGIKTDNQVFALNKLEYIPIEVTISDKPAVNITDYSTLVHPSFTLSKSSDFEYQYIHAGNKLYFNQNIQNKEIRVSYRWITEYIKLIGKLQCNEPINPSLTPKVNTINIFLNNLIL